MKTLVTQFAALSVLSLVCACGAKFQAEDGTGGGGQGGTSTDGGSAGKGGSSAGGSSAGGSSAGGSSAGGASAGSGGSGPCEAGGSCDSEGSSCSDGACCPCYYECRGGTWTWATCASCPAPACPPEPPADGQACGACQDPVGSFCSWDRCDTSLGRYGGTCDGSRWSVSVQPCSGDGCCSSDEECASRICVSGVCKVASAGGCWRSKDCGAGAVCSGASVCPCGAACLLPDQPGTCVSAN
jgi:hypothetical protein